MKKLEKQSNLRKRWHEMKVQKEDVTWTRLKCKSCAHQKNSSKKRLKSKKSWIFENLKNVWKFKKLKKKIEKCWKNQKKSGKIRKNQKKLETYHHQQNGQFNKTYIHTYMLIISRIGKNRGKLGKIRKNWKLTCSSSAIFGIIFETFPWQFLGQ